MKTKSVSYLLLLAMVICIINACTKKSGGEVLVKFTNKTGHKLKELVINQQKIGSLNTNETTKYFSFQSITIDGGQPIVAATAEIEGQIINNSENRNCGTMWTESHKGRYAMKIKIVRVNNTNRLQLN